MHTHTGRSAFIVSSAFGQQEMIKIREKNSVRNKLCNDEPDHEDKESGNQQQDHREEQEPDWVFEWRRNR